MLSFLKRSRHDEVQHGVDENRVLLDEFVALDPSRQDEAAETLATLWQCFVEVFGGPASFRGKPRTVQDAYIAKFERVAARSCHVKHTEKGHLHYSVALMVRFLVAARDHDRRPSALDLSDQVAGLINRARERQLETTRSLMVVALTKSLENPSPPLSAEAMVGLSLEFPEAAGDAPANRGDRDGIFKLHPDRQLVPATLRFDSQRIPSAPTS
jgi:hypothetical protein